MKKLVAIVAAFLFAATALLAGENPAVKYVTKDFSYKNFDGISVSGIVDVRLVKSNSYKVSVNLPEDVEPYLKVTVINGVLKISLESIPTRVSRILRDWHMTADVAMPELRSLEMSGATQFHCEDSFDLGGKDFKAEISGATKVNKLDINAKNLYAQMSGAAVAAIHGDFTNAIVEMSGAAKSSLVFSADKLTMEVSGSARPNLNGDFNDIKLEVSGAADFVWSGNAKTASMTAGGAAKVKASGAIVDDAKVETVGAAKCDVNVRNRLSIKASGASDVRYVGYDGLMLDLVSIGRGASVSKTR